MAQPNRISQGWEEIKAFLQRKWAKELVATDGAIAAFGRDGRRLRPNLVIGGINGLDERKWPGRRLRTGGVVIDLDSLGGPA